MRNVVHAQDQGLTDIQRLQRGFEKHYTGVLINYQQIYTERFLQCAEEQSPQYLLGNYYNSTNLLQFQVRTHDPSLYPPAPPSQARTSLGSASSDTGLNPDGK